MRYALSGSLLVHAAIFGMALIGFVWPKAEDAPAPGAVTVDIISMSSVSTNTTSTIESSSTDDLISSGAETSAPPVIEPIEPETATPISPAQQAIEPEVAEPVTAQPVGQAQAEAIEPDVAEPVQASIAEPIQPSQSEAVEPTETVLATAMLSAEPAEIVAPSVVPPVEPVAAAEPTQALPPSPPEPVTPIVPDALQPETSSDARTAPVPQILSFQRPSEPTPRRTMPRREPVPERPRQQVAEQAPQRPASAAGNGGQNAADAAAGRASAGQQGSDGGGGQAEIAQWQSQVQRKLARSLRYPRAANGERGEVVVRFTVAAQGGASGVSIVRSSGNVVLDQAAIETVGRASPFPPIPANAGFASKTFDFPLGFVRN